MNAATQSPKPDAADHRLSAVDHRIPAADELARGNDGRTSGIAGFGQEGPQDDSPSKRERLAWFVGRIGFRDGWSLFRTLAGDSQYRGQAWRKAKRLMGRSVGEPPVCDVGHDPLLDIGIISTDRLRLEPLRRSHFDGLAEIFPAETTGALAGSPLRSRSPRMNDLALLSDLANNDRTWVIHDCTVGSNVGVCAIGRYHVGGHWLTEVGYWLGASHRGRGYATEAAAAVLAEVRQKLDRPMLGSLIGPDNEASIAVAKRLGMICQGPVEFRGGTALLFLTPSTSDRDAVRDGEGIADASSSSSIRQTRPR